MALWEALSNAAERPVDLVELSRAGYIITGEALRGVRIMGSNERHAKILSRMLLDKADFGPLYERILKERRDAWLNS